MSDYMPTTQEVRTAYGAAVTFPTMSLPERRRAFDRWLEQVRAEAWEEGRLASDTAWEHEYDGHPAPERELCPECSTGNPYRQDSECATRGLS